MQLLCLSLVVMRCQPLRRALGAKNIVFHTCFLAYKTSCKKWVSNRKESKWNNTTFNYLQ
ncbi:hypothetical protein DDN31_18125 [Vibrio cholerae]|nr:hypothetical protein [Vibrio cholerae]